MIIPGILEETSEKALQEINLMGNLAQIIQLDIADGLLVNGKTFLDLSFLVDLDISAEMRLHLMVQKPESFLLTLPPIIGSVCAQAEAFIYKPTWIESFIDISKAKGLKVGLSFNPQTLVDDFEEYFSRLDYIQFMCIDPGGQGRPFVMDVLNKINNFKGSHPNMPLQVDGGINQQTLRMVVKAGADSAVIGSQIFKQDNPAQKYKDFVLQFEHAQRDFYNS